MSQRLHYATFLSGFCRSVHRARWHVRLGCCCCACRYRITRFGRLTSRARHDLASLFAQRRRRSTERLRAGRAPLLGRCRVKCDDGKPWSSGKRSLARPKTRRIHPSRTRGERDAAGSDSSVKGLRWREGNASRACRLQGEPCLNGCVVFFSSSPSFPPPFCVCVCSFYTNCTYSLTT